MNWVQVYNPLNNMLLSALVAAIPLLLVLYMLGIRRAKGHQAALLGTGSQLLWPLLYGECLFQWQSVQRSTG